MSLVRKCDRCDKIFEPDREACGHKRVFTKIKIEWRWEDRCISEVCMLDLCNDCNDSFEKWATMAGYMPSDYEFLDDEGEKETTNDL